MGDDTGVEGLRQHADLLHMGDASRNADVGPDVGDTRALEILGELPDRRVAFAGGDRESHFGGEGTKRSDAVGGYGGPRRKVAERRADFGTQQQGVTCRHVSVQLDAEVDPRVPTVSRTGRETGHQVVDPRRLAHLMVFVLEEQDLQGAIALCLDGVASGGDQLLDRVLLDEHFHGSYRPRRARPPSNCQTGTSKCLALRSHRAWSTALMAPVTAMPLKQSPR